MSIDKSGKWWKGSSPEDIREFLEAYASKGYEINEFRLAKCACGCDRFRLEADDNSGVARRHCAECESLHYICDSEQFWDEADATEWKCLVCESELTNIGVGFSMYPDDPTAIKWLYVGVRCASCHVLGCYAGWKVAEGGVLHFLDQV